MKATPPAYLSAEQALAILTFFSTTAALRKATHRLGIPHIKVGRRLAYIESELHDFMATKAADRFGRKGRRAA